MVSLQHPKDESIVALAGALGNACGDVRDLGITRAFETTAIGTVVRVLGSRMRMRNLHSVLEE